MHILHLLRTMINRLHARDITIEEPAVGTKMNRVTYCHVLITCVCV